MADDDLIVIKKKKAGHGGHHGGAWKVAYADFVTAMMALFIVLWLMNSSKPIQVMQRMENISEVGRGIAVAFVATIYGVGAANLFFLPCAGRIRILNGKRHALREMIVDAAVGIAEGLGAGAIEQRLTPYVSAGKSTASRSAPLVAR